jgi:hypothetical protein
MINDLSGELAKKGFSIVSSDRDSLSQEGDRRQVIAYDLDPDPAVRKASFEKAMDRALKEVQGGKGYVVSYAPKMESGPQIADQYAGKSDVTVITDAYTDHDPDNGYFPDIMARVGLARNIAFYYMGDDKDAALGAIVTLLNNISMIKFADVKSLEALISLLNKSALMIRPVQYNKDINECIRRQKALATSL